MVREATDLDIGALMPLFRGYCNFYEAKPSDEGLERMARALIASPRKRRSCLSWRMKTRAR